MMMRPFSGLFLIGVLAACGDPTGAMPRRFDGRYAAGTVGQTPLPVIARFVDAERTLHADTLTFSADGNAERIIVVRLQEFFEPFRDIRLVVRYSYTYSINGRSLRLDPVCIAGRACSRAVDGRIDEDRLMIPSDLLGLDYGRLFMDRIR